MSSGRCEAQQWILRALRVEMKKRPGVDGLDWIDNERMAVTVAANEWAAAIGRPAVTVADVERVEQRAVGHIDYASKLSLYVAELIYEAQRPASETTP